MPSLERGANVNMFIREEEGVSVFVEDTRTTIDLLSSLFMLGHYE